MEDYKKTALQCMENIIAMKMADGMEKRDAVLAIKKEMAHAKGPLHLGAEYKDAFDAIQKGENCTLDGALVSLKLIFRERYNDYSTAWKE